jgi:hypothetical protein
MRAPRLHVALVAAVVAPTVLAAGLGDARGDLANFDLGGKMYTKFMYKNDATQGCLSLSNPFWVDNIGGSNGVCTEFELNIKGTVGKSVTAGMRLQSRWGSMWQDWWENGDLKQGVAFSGGDTSGESLGMNHAQYIKLRGVWARFAPPIPTVKWITVGATDFSMWNEWTIGKSRYIDRDNGNGVIIEGEALSKKRLSYTVGAMALPKLYVGPGWNTGIAFNDPLASLYGTDWGFAAKLESQLMNDLKLKLIGSWLQDWEADRYSPFLTGAPEASRDADHSVSLVTRFRGINGTLDASYNPGQLDWLTVNGLFAASSNYVNPDYATNLVRNGQGFSPVLFTTNDQGESVASTGLATVVRAEASDPFEVGLSLKAEYFNIGSEFNALFGARREADVLLTDGIIAGGFTRGGQLPTLNIANEFVDWDEPWYEACIGWHGGTAVVEYLKGTFKAMAEYTFIGYNTNMQNRDVDNQYPDFLYTNGFTDTTAFTADMDYANKFDRGKDPRSVYADFQQRQTHIAVATAQYPLPAVVPWSPILGFKYKFVNDLDRRKSDNPDDNYDGKSHLLFASLSVQPTNELKTTLGYEYTHWDEAKRTGSQTGGFYDSVTDRHTFRGGVTYTFGGVIFTYTLEYFHKYLDRDETAYYDMKWNVWRSKGTFEVAF